MGYFYHIQKSDGEQMVTEGFIKKLEKKYVPYLLSQLCTNEELILGGRVVKDIFAWAEHGVYVLSLVAEVIITNK